MPSEESPSVYVTDDAGLLSFSAIFVTDCVVSVAVVKAD